MENKNTSSDSNKNIQLLNWICAQPNLMNELGSIYDTIASEESSPDNLDAAEWVYF